MANTAKVVLEIRRSFSKHIFGTNPFGTTWFVDATNGSDDVTGRRDDDAFKTIAKFISSAAAGDTVVLSPENHSVDVSVAALIPKARMQFIGAIPSYGGMPSTIISVDADDGNDMITIDVDGVYFKDIMFQHFLNAGTAIRLFNIAATTAVNGLAFVDCWFDMNSADVAGGTALNIDDATNLTTGLVLKNCHFVNGDATTNADNQYMDIGVRGITHSLIEDCVFLCESTDDDYVAMRFADPSTTGRGYGTVIRRNHFIGPSDGAVTLVPIVATGGSSGEFAMQWSDNRFSYCTVNPLAVDLWDQSLVLNHVGDLTAGGTLVDAGT